MLTPLTGEAPRMARVVYCQPRPAGGYYVGLYFPDRSVRWEEGPASKYATAKLAQPAVFRKARKPDQKQK